ncbi:MAG: DUF5724 domain-containing protein [Planctomycetaceae bacterium]
MLKPEVAAKRLEEFAVAEPEEKRLAAIRKLPAKLRAIGYAFVDLNVDGSEFDGTDWYEHRQELENRATRIEMLSRRDRATLLKALCGPLAEAAERACEFITRLPYQDSYARRAFRLAKSGEAHRSQRMAIVRELADLAAGYRDDFLTIENLAAWTPYVAPYRAPQVGRVLAAVIDAGGQPGDAVFEILRQSARNEHEIGQMGRHVAAALLSASRPEGWELMEKTLLAAQRQEGLRQVILESVDEAHPQAFRRMLRLILDHDLIRFSAVTRAVDAWFGMQWDSASAKVVRETIETALCFLEEGKEGVPPSDVRRKALDDDDPQRAYLALWSIAFEDAGQSIPLAAKMLSHPSAEMRYVAVDHLVQTSLDEAQPHLSQALEDDELAVAMRAAYGIGEPDAPAKRSRKERVQLFDRLERLMERLPEKPRRVPFSASPGGEIELRRDVVAGKMVQCLGDLPPTRLIPHLAAFDKWTRARVVAHLAAQKKWDGLTRETLFRIAGDASADIRGAALGALANLKSMTDDEVRRLEGYLSRKANDLRSNVIELLLKRNDPQALESADRLTASVQANHRLAGLELLRQMAEADRARAECIARAEEYRDGRKRLSRDEQSQLDAIFASTEVAPTLDDGLGLMNPANRSPVIRPKPRTAKAVTDAAMKVLAALDDLVHEHRDTAVQIRNWQNQLEEMLVGNLNWGFPSPRTDRPIEPQLRNLPLAEVWREWHAKRPKAMRDADGCELFRAHCWLELTESDWQWKSTIEWLKGKGREGLKKLFGHPVPKLKYPRQVKSVLEWLLALEPPAQAWDLSLDIAETAMAAIPEADMNKLVDADPLARLSWRYGHHEDGDWRSQEVVTNWLVAASSLPVPKSRERELMTRLWNLVRFEDQPCDGAPRHFPPVEMLLSFYDEGYATLDDVADNLIGPRTSNSFEAISHLTARGLHPSLRPIVARHPEVLEKVDAIVARILDIELARGEAETVVTPAAMAINSLAGIETLLRLLAALGKEPFKKGGWAYGERKISRAEVLTHLVEVCYPAAGESPDEFARRAKQAIKEGRIPEERILQLAFLAPQWAAFVEACFRWDGFSEGLYWFLAHMTIWGDATEKAAVAADYEADAVDSCDADPDAEAASTDGEETDEEQPRVPEGPKLSAWDRLILERTPLFKHERNVGAVDVDWFHRTFQRLKAKRWEALAAAARFAANPAQAKRAQFIGDVLLGRVKKTELLAGIRDRKLKEHVRMLGLLPLAGGAKRDKDLRDRYEVIQEYRKYANGLSSMSKPGALLACEVGMQNLARLAGYADPLRLEWAMEAASTRDLAAGPVVIEKGDVAMTLSLDDRAQPELVIQRNGKVLKSLPASHKKGKSFLELRERAKELKRKGSRVRQSLEAAMCRGDIFTGKELGQIAEHALLWPLLSRLVIVGEGIAGYPDKQGKVLRDHAGNLEPIKKGERLRIAHPGDLLATREWHQWQHECFHAERMQPFKQIFRELYVVTKQEKADKTVSRRYAGQQIHPQQAFALWGARGWSTEDGVWKTFHDVGIIASVDFDYGPGTPLEVEGLQLDVVAFRNRDDYRPLKLTDVPPRIFSETMRDVDLVVSVAHRGEVDPEASASTVEMRTALLRETCDLLGLGNVKLQGSHATIRGELGDYSVHLGSGVVHRQPGGAVCIVPVHAQHRGRLFLPFADDDPRTAEVIAKVLLLARDLEIQDPTILEQLQAVAGS